MTIHSSHHSSLPLSAEYVFRSYMNDSNRIDPTCVTYLIYPHFLWLNCDHLLLSRGDSRCWTFVLYWKWICVWTIDWIFYRSFGTLQSSWSRELPQTSHLNSWREALNFNLCKNVSRIASFRYMVSILRVWVFLDDIGKQKWKKFHSRFLLAVNANVKSF